MLVLYDDLLVLPAGNKYWILMNVFTRTCLAVETEVLRILEEPGALEEEIKKSHKGEKKFKVREIERFGNIEGLVENPTCFENDRSRWGEEECLDLDSLIKRFSTHFITAKDKKSYLEVFQEKQSFIDKKHRGNFHQQLGQYLMMKRRAKPAEWWLTQKFSPDMTELRDNLYKWVQGYSLEKYFSGLLSENDRVLDLGCGIGYYANMIAGTGASVLGIDPNDEYIAFARQNALPNAEFRPGMVGEAGALDAIRPDSFDYVFMSDALLFYFVPMYQGQKADLKVLFQDIKRILKKNGKLISVEPHYIFWNTPWLGEEERPFTVVTEYTEKQFGIIINLGRFLQAFIQNGFVITNYQELIPDPASSAKNVRAYNFARQFPQWHLVEAQPMTFQ